MTKILEIENCLKCPFRQSLTNWQPDFCIRVGKMAPTIKTFPKFCPLPDKEEPPKEPKLEIKDDDFLQQLKETYTWAEFNRWKPKLNFTERELRRMNRWEGNNEKS